MGRVLPVVERIAERHAPATIFTRFIPAHDTDELPGSWRRYYRRWSEMTLSHLAPDLVELLPPLARLAPPATVIDKRVYSPFTEHQLPRLLQQRRIASLVITGAETDMCVLAAVLDAVDRGYRVVLAEDGLCSSCDATHDALMMLYHRRFDQQIEIADSVTILHSWHHP
jgi:nicotinamidase-related amidase